MWRNRMYRRPLTIYLVAPVLLAAFAGSSGQSLQPDLDRVSRAVETYIQQTRSDWRHETAPPATPPGVRPSPDVAIHYWSSEKCMTDVGNHQISCRIKLAIDQSASPSVARDRLAEFSRRERTASAISVGDQGYTWRGGIVFIKGKFTFSLSGRLDSRVGDFTNNAAFLETLAKQIAGAAPAT